MNITEKIKKVFSNGETSSLVHLNTEKANKFIDYIKDESTLLRKIRVEKMEDSKKTIATIGIGKKILQPAGRSNPVSSSEFLPDSIELSSKKMKCMVDIFDDELEDNIEKGAFQDHLMRMVAKQVANELEEASIYGRHIGDTPSTPNVVFINNQVDGWLANAGIVLDASDANVFSDRIIDKNKLSKMRKSLKTKYRRDAEIFMSDGLILDYADKYEALSTGYNTVDQRGAFGKPFNNTPLMNETGAIVKIGGVSTTISTANTQGQTTITVASASGITEGMVLVLTYGDTTEWAGIVNNVSGNTITFDEAVPYKYSSGATVHEGLLDSSEIIMSDPRNLIWGIQRDIRIEFQRDATLEKTIMVLTIRNDFQVENKEALVVMKNLKVK